MKAMSKQELAYGAGVSVKTLMNWLQPYQKELQGMGMKQHAKVLPPNVVQWICNRFCIDV
jgi:hypothetical protein